MDDRTIAERDLDDLIDYTLDQLDKEAKRKIEKEKHHDSYRREFVTGAIYRRCSCRKHGHLRG